MSNQTLRKAPILCFSELKEDRCNTERFYKLPQELMDAVMYGLIPSDKIDKLDKPPPVNTSKNPKSIIDELDPTNGN